MSKRRADSSATLMLNGGTNNNIICEGYMLKKKRKKMQGMARRYFCLSSTGALSYSFHPNSPIRDSIIVSLAFVYASRKQRVFHIDSGRTVMHCKALTEADFDSWTTALRGFIGAEGGMSNGGGPAGRGNGSPFGEKEGNDYDEDEQDEFGAEGDLERVLDTIGKMSKPLQDLEGIHQELKSGEGGAAIQTVSTSMSFNASSPQSTQKFKFLKKGKDSPRIEDYFDAKSPSDAIIRKLGQSLATLKAQHAFLTSLLPALTSNQQSHHSSRPSSATGIQFSSRLANSSRSPFALHGVNVSRASSFSLASEETGDEYYEDARTGGAGEFFLEEEDADRVLEEDEDDYYEEDEDEYDEEEEQEIEKEAALRKVSNASKLRREQVDPSSIRVDRRKVLPAACSGEEFSMLGMLRKNVGKDLSTISFPVTFNEPLSALQRIAEEFEYSELLHKAAAEPDSIERLILVATFIVTGVVGNKFRSSRKPFNPLLGETYECIRPDKELKFISEKVSHHPPIMAFHAESIRPSSSSKTSPAWSIDGHVAPSQKFWGMSFELMFPGEFRITFDDTGDCFEVQKPSSFVKNLVAGTKYLEIVGESTVTNTRTGEKAVIDFKEGSSWGGASGRNKIEAKIMDRSGKVKAELMGRWDESVDRKKGGKEFQRVWEVGTFDKNPARFYGFSPFSITLNETTAIEADNLPTSDSRLRPDQIALEKGDIDEAEAVKVRVEEKQREKRKKTVGVHQPQFFSSFGGENEVEGEVSRKEWKYKGDYFEKRAAGTLVDVDIF